MMNAGALADIMMREMDEGLDNTELKTTVISWISDTIDEFLFALNESRAAKETISISTVASQAEYELDGDIYDIRDIRIPASDETIDFADETVLAGIATDLQQLGKPRFWFFGDPQTDANNNITYVIRLVPIPDAIYPIEIVAVKNQNFVPLTTNDILPIRPEHLFVIKHRVRAYMLDDDKDYEGSQKQLQIFYAKVEEIKGKEQSRPAQQTRRMQVRDIPSRSANNRLVRNDPSHFRN